MMELPPGNNNGGAPLSLPSTSAEVTAAGSKRSRRPSVRLGEIGGDHHDDSQGRKPKWNKKDMIRPPTKTRALTNLSSVYEITGALDDERVGNVDHFGAGSWRVKKRVGSSTGAAKRVRSSWVSRNGDESEGGFRDFSREDSESSLKEESLVRDGNSSGNREFELSVDEGGGREGVKIWLQELGLGRYWPMFEIHEVDDEVLPLLTLDDLKDMGINAVGSRRKMLSAIQKLGREFSS